MRDCIIVILNQALTSHKNKKKWQTHQKSSQLLPTSVTLAVMPVGNLTSRGKELPRNGHGNVGIHRSEQLKQSAQQWHFYTRLKTITFGEKERH